MVTQMSYIPPNGLGARISNTICRKGNRKLFEPLREREVLQASGIENGAENDIGARLKRWTLPEVTLEYNMYMAIGGDGKATGNSLYVCERCYSPG